MPLIHYSEMDDFKATIIKAGLNVDDFEVTEQADAVALVGIAQWSRVKAQKTGETETSDDSSR